MCSYMDRKNLRLLIPHFYPGMLWFNGVEAAVSVNDVELPRYQTTFDTPNDTVTCWVPSEAGKVRSKLTYKHYLMTTTPYF
jgi:hypothetical protein